MVNKYIRPTIKNTVVVPKRDNIVSYILAFVAVVSLIFNYIVMKETAYPKPDLRILESSLCFDGRAINEESYLDSLYVILKLYNDGNKTTSINEILFNLEETSNTPLVVRYMSVSPPKPIYRGENSILVVKIIPLRLGPIYPDQSQLYKLPYKPAYEEWKKMAHKLSFYMDFPLERYIWLETTINYGNDWETEKSIKINNVKAIDPNKYR